MRCFFLIAAVLIALTAAHAEGPAGYDEHINRAREAFADENWAEFALHLDAAQTFRPYSLYIWKNRILAHQLAGDSEKALALAKNIAERGLAMDFSGHDGFEALKSHPDFQPIAARMEANLKSFGKSIVSSFHDDSDLLPEAYARDGNGREYVGSVRTGKILEVAGDVITTASGGVFDIEIRSDQLWAAVNNQLAYKDADPENKFAAIMVFDRKSGTLEREFRANGEDALFGDIEVADNGTVYASDSITPRLFRLLPDGKRIEPFAADPAFANLQGIALDEAGGRIFLADYLTGLFVVDAKTGAAQKVENTVEAHLGGIDGLYLYDGDLIGVQNGTTPQRIVRIGLDAQATKTVRFEILAQNLEEWNEPTHGAVFDDVFYYIASSNWPSYDSDWQVREGAKLQPVRIMATPLK